MNDRIKLTDKALEAYIDSCKGKSISELMNSKELSLYPFDQRLVLCILFVNGGSMTQGELEAQFDIEREKLLNLN